MSFLLDTHVVSEWTKPGPNPGLMNWLSAVDEDQVFLSVVTIAELRHGIERLSAGRRRDRLDKWLSDELLLRFEGQVLAVNPEIAQSWGRLVARCEAQGHPINAMDALIQSRSRVSIFTSECSVLCTGQRSAIASSFSRVASSSPAGKRISRSKTSIFCGLASDEALSVACIFE